MTTDLAIRLGNTFIGAVTRPVPATPHYAAVPTPGFWRKLGRAAFQAPGRIMASLNRRQAERDALIRYAMSEGKHLGIGRGEVERAVLLTGRADMLFPSYFVNAQRR
jgi:hypothetical protein